MKTPKVNGTTTIANIDIARTLTNLELPVEEYVVVGSGVLGALGLREINDIDLVVSQALFEHLEGLGDWQREMHPELNEPIMRHGDVEAFTSWDKSGTAWQLADLKLDQRVIADIPYVSLERLREWKVAKGRDKDKQDIILIDAYLKSHS